jgi:hypothetical protein
MSAARHDTWAPSDAGFIGEEIRVPDFHSGEMVPIFIGGCGRSGTTMLGAMLGAANNAIVVPESQFKTECMPSEVEAALPLRDHLETILSHRRFRLRRFPLSESDFPRPDEPMTFPEAISGIVRQYAFAMTGRESPRFWIDHTPNNLRHAQELLRMFPLARFVHIVRDPRAVYASVRDLDWGPETAWEAGAWWVMKVAWGITCQKELGDRLLTTRYEDLVTCPEQELARICQHAGVEFLPDMVVGTDLPVTAYTKHQHGLVAKRPEPARIDAWRRSLNKREISHIEHFAESLMAYFGYPLAADGEQRRNLDSWGIISEAFSRLVGRRKHRSRRRRRRRSQ